MGGSPVKSLLQTSCSVHLDIDLFNGTFKHENDCKDTVQRNGGKTWLEMNFRSAIRRKTLDVSQELQFNTSETF